MIGQRHGGNGAVNRQDRYSGNPESASVQIRVDCPGFGPASRVCMFSLLENDLECVEQGHGWQGPGDSTHVAGAERVPSFGFCPPKVLRGGCHRTQEPRRERKKVEMELHLCC